MKNLAETSKKMRKKMMTLILSKIQQRKSLKKKRRLRKLTMTSKMKLREILTKTRMSISLPLTRPGLMAFQSIILSIPTIRTSRPTLRLSLARIRFLKKCILSGARMCLKHSQNLPKQFPKWTWSTKIWVLMNRASFKVSMLWKRVWHHSKSKASPSGCQWSWLSSSATTSSIT